MVTRSPGSQFRNDPAGNYSRFSSSGHRHPASATTHLQSASESTPTEGPVNYAGRVFSFEQWAAIPVDDWRKRPLAGPL